LPNIQKRDQGQTVAPCKLHALQHTLAIRKTTFRVRWHVFKNIIVNKMHINFAADLA